MEKYFNIKFEFNKIEVDNKIESTIHNRKKGYVCVVDGNVLATSYKNKEYRQIINNSTINTCDGSSIAILAGLIHRKNFVTYTGPEIFEKFSNRNYKHYLLGNTTENLNKLLNHFKKTGCNIENYKFQSLPFMDVDEFDYKLISDNINQFKPDFIWISLGAPKQELFIHKLYPYINQGLLFAIGAAFNLFIGNTSNSRAPKWLRKVHLEWLYRVIKEPKRVGKRAWNYFKILPILIYKELKNKHNETTGQKC